jgi:glycosyltransferase involved in cell wall biosynthesis
MTQVSIIMPTFNAAKYLPESIGSVLDQDYADFELIVVDDCSEDNTREVVSSFVDDRIKYRCLKQNHGGPSLPRNIGFCASLGDYISFFDSDDIMLPGKIMAGVTALEEYKNLALVFTDACKIQENGVPYDQTLLEEYTGLKRLLTEKSKGGLFVLHPKDAFELLFEENYIPTSSVMVRRDVLLNVGPFDESLLNGDDRDLWYRITRNCSVGYLSAPLHKYRIRPASVSKRGVRTAQNRIKVLQKQVASGLPWSLEEKAMALLARNYWGIGYALRKQGEMGAARRNFIESLRCQFRLHTVRSYLTTFLGTKLLKVLRPQ